MGQTSGGHPVKFILKSRGNLKLRWHGIHHLNLKITNYIHKTLQSGLNSISKEVITTLWLLFIFSKHVMTNKSWYYKKNTETAAAKKRMQPLKNNYFIMARTQKVEYFSEMCIRVLQWAVQWWSTNNPLKVSPVGESCFGGTGSLTGEETTCSG